MKAFYFSFFISRESFAGMLPVWALAVFLFLGGGALGQTITVGDLKEFNPNSLPYANSGNGPDGSQITVPFKMSGCFTLGNKFELIMSDKNGVFNTTKPNVIGTFAWHFATFINGKIPGGTAPGTNYKLKLHTTSPETYTDIPTPISIVTGVAPSIDLDCTSKTTGADPAFGSCDYVSSATFSLINKSINATSVSAKIFVDSVATLYSSLTFDTSLPVSPPLSVQVGEGYYSAVVTATINNVISTFAYPILNCRKNFALLLVPGNECIQQSFNVTFVTEGINSVYRNYPGYIYRVSWGDNGKDSINICELKENEGKIPHTYKKNTSSCGVNFKDEEANVTYFNRYKVIVTGISPYCDPEITVKPSKVNKPPVIIIEPPVKGLCVNNKIQFLNKSMAGATPGEANEANCNGKTFYSFYVDGSNTPAFTEINSDGKPKPFEYSFLTPGEHRIKVTASTGGCPSDTTVSVCISAEPKPVFDIATTSFCRPATVTFTNQTDVTFLCGATVKYQWALLTNAGDEVQPGSATFNFINGTSATSRNAEMRIYAAGNYKISLKVGNFDNCGYKELVKPLIISREASVAFNGTLPTVCQNAVIDFSQDPLKARLVYSDNSNLKKYKWTISPACEFVDGSSDTSAYPKLLFKNTGLHTIKVRYENECSFAESSTISVDVKQSPLIDDNKRLADAVICNNVAGTFSYIDLMGQAPGTDQSGQWRCISAPHGIDKATVLSDQSIDIFQNRINVGLKLTDGQLGKYLFEWSIFNGACIVRDTVELKVYPKPESGKVVNLNPDLCSGDYANLKVIEFGGEILRWEYSTDNVTWLELANSSNKDTISRKTLVDTYYRVALGNCNLSQPYYADKAFVDVTPLPTAGTLGANFAVCKGSSGVLELSGFSAGSSLKWYQKEQGAITWLQIPNQILATYSYSDLQKTTHYRVEISKSGCPVLSDSLTVTVNEKPVFEEQSNIHVCANSEVAQIDFALKDAISGVPVSYVWTCDDSSLGYSTPQTTAFIPKFTATNNTRAHRVISFKVTPIYSHSGINCEGTQNVIKVIVLPNIKLDALADTTVCTGSKIVRQPSHNAGSLLDNAKIQYRWQVRELTVAKGSGVISVIGETSGLSDTMPALRATNNTQAVIDSYVDIIPVYTVDDYSCDGTAISYKIRINTGTAPKAGKDTVLCSTSSYKLNANAAPTGTVGTWTVIPSAGVTLSNNSDPKATASGLVAGTTYTFSWTFTGGACVVASEVKVTVLSKLNAKFTKNAKGSCTPQGFEFTNISTPALGLTYKWFYNNVLISTDKDLKLTAAQVLASKKSIYQDSIHRVKLVVEYPNTNCAIDSMVDTVVVYAKPKAAFLPSKTDICGAQNISFKNLSLGSSFIPTDYILKIYNVSKTFEYQDIIMQDFTLRNVHFNAVTKRDTFIVKLMAKNACVNDYSIDSVRIVCSPTTIEMGLRVDGTYLYGCGPHSVKIENKTRGGDQFLYEIFKGTNLEFSKMVNNSDPLLYTFEKGGAYKVKLTAYNYCSTASDSLTINVVQSDADFALAKDKYCVGEKLKFLFPSGKLDSYQWDFGDGEFSPLSDPDKSYKTSGTYKIKVRGTKILLGVGGVCESQDSLTVIIIDTPKASFTSNASAVNCNPFVLNVKCTTANAFFVEWDFSDPAGKNNKIAGPEVSHSFEQGGTYAVKMKVYNENGCVDSIVQNVFISAKPKAILTASQLICGSTAPLQLSAGAYAGNNNIPLSYEWRMDRIASPLGPDSPTLNYTFSLPANVQPPYTDIVRLVIKNKLTGCADTAYQSIIYKARPVPDFTVVGGTSGCVPLKISVTNISKFKAFVDRYEWLLDDVVVSNDETPDIAELSVPNRTYRLKLRVSNFDCSYSAESSVKTITTFPLPKASFELKESEGCYGSVWFEVKSNASTTGLTNAGAYTWRIDNGIPETTFTPVPRNLGQGVHTVELTVNNGVCTDKMVKTVRVIDLQKPKIVPSVNIGCGILKVSFKSAAKDALKYFWDFGDGFSDTTANPVHTFYANADEKPYKVVLNVANGNCSSSSDTVLIKLYHKPFVNFKVLPDSVIKAPNFTFTFFNMTGKAQNYRWSFGDGGVSFDQNPTHSYTTMGEFKVELTAVNEFGCDSMMSRMVRIDSIPCYMYVPNAFQPDNVRPELSVFKPKAYGLKQGTYSLRIFSRYGEMIWGSNKLSPAGEPEEGWNGKLKNDTEAPQGVYIWDISGEFIDGTEWKGMSYSGPNGKKMRSGTLTLIR